MSALKKALICNPDTPNKKFYVQFNPNTLEYSAGRSQENHKGVSTQGGEGSAREPQLQSSPLSAPKGAVLSVKLFYHTYAGPDSYTDVRASIHNIRAFLPPAPGNGNSSSPKIKFAWGTLTHTGTLESFHVSYQMFASDGTPVQAEVSISILGEDPDVSAKSTDQARQAEEEIPTEPPDEDPVPDDIAWMYEDA